ncbi:MAG: hypothetical protein LBT53_09830 [Puniceicoccales bacterium]|jgi:hypothetical protein|nr:hypothetical protein [Puniceicoccales bacterium]
MFPPITAAFSLLTALAFGRRRLMLLSLLALVAAGAYFLPDAHYEQGNSRIKWAYFLVMLGFMGAGASKGYSRGPLRQLATVAALTVAGSGAWLLGPSFGHLALKSAGVPLLLRGVVGALLLGALLWLAALTLLWNFGKPRVNELGETDNPVLGAVVGCWTGVLWGGILALAIASLGAFAQFWLDTTPDAPDSTTRGALRRLVLVKNSLALLPGGGGLRTWNPLPARPRRTLEKAVRLFGTPGGYLRIQRASAVRAFLTDPAIYPLTQDKEIIALLQKRDAEALLAHPRIRRLLADDEAQKKILELAANADIDAILDEALGQKPARPRNPDGSLPPPSAATSATSAASAATSAASASSAGVSPSPPSRPTTPPTPATSSSSPTAPVLPSPDPL